MFVTLFLNNINMISINNRILLTIFLCFLYQINSAQNAPQTLIMEVDAATGILNNELPFDVSFNLKIKINKADRIKKVTYTNLNKRDKIRPSFISLRSQILRKNAKKEGKNILFSFEPIKDDIKHKYLVLRIDPLAPNTGYDIIIEKKFSGKTLKELIKLNALFRDSNSEKLADFIKLEQGDVNNYNDFFKRLTEKEKKNNKPIDSTIYANNISKNYLSILNKDSEWDTYTKDTVFNKIFKQYIKVVEHKVNNSFKLFINQGTKEINPPYNLSTYKAIFDLNLKEEYDKLNKISAITYDEISGLINTPDLFKIFKLFKEGKVFNSDDSNFKESLKLISNFKSLTNKKITKILSGRGSITGNYNDVLVSKNDLDERLNYLISNKKALNVFIDDLKSVRLFIPSIKEEHSIGLDVDISKILTDINTLISKIDNSKKIIEEIIETNLQFYGNTTENTLQTNTLMSTISSEASRLVIPDFGLVMGIQPGNNFLRPFVGANINFAPVNKDIRTRYMSNGLAPGVRRPLRYIRQHFSVMLGLSIGSIKVENKRDDLLSGFNVLTGISYRPGRIARISSGILWYNSVNPNPIVSNEKMAGLWYCSISFDIEIKKAGGSTFNKIF
jgi:hypothetical protein